MKVLLAMAFGRGVLLILLFNISLSIRSISCETIEAPVILNGTVIRHLEGQTLTLSCEGEEKLKWSHSHFDIKKNDRINATLYKKDQFGLRNKYSSTLTVKNMLQDESGVLFCEYESPNLTSFNDNIYIHVYKGSEVKAHKHGFFSVSRIIIVVIVGLLVAIAVLAALLHRYKSNLRELHDKLKDKPETNNEEELKHLRTNDDKDKTENMYHLRRRVGQTDQELDFDEPDSLPLDSTWEFPRKRLKLGAQIGSGAFGRVLKAEAIGILPDNPKAVTTVAVKMVKGNADESHVRALMCELKVMANLGRNINVVNLLGACTKDCMLNDELYVIVEFCTHGSLLSFIRRNNKHFVNQLKTDGNDEFIDTNMNNQRTMSFRGKPIGGSDNLNYVVTMGESSTSGNYTGSGQSSSSYPLPRAGATSTMSFQFEFQQEQAITTTDLLCWAFQIARGMEYLSSRKVIHGDLAARNVLLTDNNVVKICDFGLAKEMYKDYYYKMSTKTKEGKFPIKWMAIESILYGELSSESDCWSFGVVLWELFSLGKLPYIGIKADDDLIRRIENGYRMEKPEYAPCSVQNIMNECWAGEKRNRPSFSTLVNEIGAIIEGDLREHYVQLNRDYVNGNRYSEDNEKEATVGDGPQLDTYGYLKPNSLNSSMRHQRSSPIKRSDTTAGSTTATVTTESESCNNSVIPRKTL